MTAADLFSVSISAFQKLMSEQQTDVREEMARLCWPKCSRLTNCSSPYMAGMLLAPSVVSFWLEGCKDLRAGFKMSIIHRG